MLVASKCLHRAVAREYSDSLDQDPSFHDFLLTVLPNMDVDRCSNCSPNCPRCDGENSEYHSNPDEFILGLERVRLGFCEDPNYGPTGFVRRSKPHESYDSSGRSISLRHAIPIDLELLSGDPRFDRDQVAYALDNRVSHRLDVLDDYSLQDDLDNAQKKLDESLVA